jgi:excinuclease ABC subunit C
VAALVVFEKAKPQKSLYRKYKIKTAAVQDDYASMSEILKRRFGNKQQSIPYPDLLMVDGGKGHLNIAVSVIKELKLDGHFAIIGIAKKDDQKRETHDKIYKPGQANPVNLGREGDLLLFLQSIRDEAHRFAISFHRQRRLKTMLRSDLDSIPGIGKKRKAALLIHFGSIKKIKAATIEELSAVPGISRNVAENVNRHMRQM